MSVTLVLAGFYQVFLGTGVSFGIIISGLIVHGTGNWMETYWVGAGLVGGVGLTVLFAFPETAYRRASIDTAHIYYTEERIEEGKSSPSEPAAITAQKNWVGRMAIFSGTYTEESLMFLRPCGLVLLPAVSWAVLVFSVTVGFLVTITTIYAVATSAPPYNFTTLQISELTVLCRCYSGGIHRNSICWAYG